MALTGIQIYKLLPKTNCKECGFPTCLAFAMKLAAKQAELSACPYVSEEAKAKLEAASAPPIRLVTVSADGHEAKAGNEVVLYRHEKTFYNKPGLFLRVYDDMSADEIQAKAKPASEYVVEYVGIELDMAGTAIQARGGDFVAAVEAVRAVSDKPLILIADPDALDAALAKLQEIGIENDRPLICAADADNWQAMAELGKKYNVPVTVKADTLEGLADLTEKLKEAGLQDIVLDPGVRNLSDSLTMYTVLRRLAIKSLYRPLGFPIIAFPGDAEDEDKEYALATMAIAKYAGFVVLDRFTPARAYPLLVLRENIYTDPQKPIQVLPGLYEFHNPGPEDPVFVTTNFSITYFSVANEIDGSGMPAWLLIADAEGMSVLTAWAAGKFDADRIAKAVREFKVEEKVSRKRIVLPGLVAVLSGELEEELPGWEVKVGPREAVDLPSYMKNVLAAE